MDINFIALSLMAEILCLVLGIVISLSLNQSLAGRRQINALRNTVLFIVAYTIVDMCTVLYIVTGVPLPVEVGRLFAEFSIIFEACVAFSWFVTLLSFNEDRWHTTRKIVAIAATPLAILTVLTVASGLNGSVFSLQADHTYTRGPLYPLLHIVCFIYYIPGIIKIAATMRQPLRAIDRRRFVIGIVICLPVITATIITLFVEMVPVMPLAYALSLFYGYVSYQQTRINTDALTGLNNRRATDTYLERAIQDASAASPLAIILIDLNDFKQVNDTHGHNKGDKALVAAADTLREAANAFNAHIARWGGDEFLFVAKADHIPAPDEFIKQLNEVAQQKAAYHQLGFDISLCAGRCICTDPNLSPAALVSAADKALYEAKTQMKEATRVRNV